MKTNCPKCGASFSENGRYCSHRICKKCSKVVSRESQQWTRPTYAMIESIKGRKKCVVCGKMDNLVIIANCSLLNLRRQQLEDAPAIHLECLEAIQKGREVPRKYEQSIRNAVKKSKKWRVK